MTNRMTTAAKSTGRISLTFALCFVILASSGCSTTRRVPLESEIGQPTESIHKSSGQKIVGYTTLDGIHHEFKGFVWFIEPDSIVFSTTCGGKSQQTYLPRALRQGVLCDQFILPRSEVATLFVPKGDTAKTVLLVLGILTATIIAMGIGLATSWN